MLTKAEWQMLADKNLTRIAKMIYTGIFNNYVDHNTQLVSVNFCTITEYLTYLPAAGSSNKPEIPTRQEIRTAIDSLEKKGLLYVVLKGDRNRKAPVYNMPFSYKRQKPKQTQAGQGLEVPTATQQQPNSNPTQQPNIKPSYLPENKGLELAQQPKQQPNQNTQQQPLYSSTVNNTVLNARKNNLPIPANQNPDVQQSCNLNCRHQLTTIIDYFINNGSTEELASEFFNYYESSNWTRPNNSKIVKFEPTANNWMHNKAMNQLKTTNQQNGNNYAKPTSGTKTVFQFAQQMQEQAGPSEWNANE
jgi:hypothetical protein